MIRRKLEVGQIATFSSSLHFSGAVLGKSLNEKTGKSSNRWRVSGGSGDEDAEGMEANFATDRHPKTNTKRS